ncbi:MAG: hypothetical protein HY720_32910 [Planctomycetes bacterium]|nr:hypothetical protein [Planctomycetota bacterium]
MLAAQASRAGCPLVFVNQVGGNDSLIFDGHSAVYDSKGEFESGSYPHPLPQGVKWNPSRESVANKRAAQEESSSFRCATP